MNPGSQLTFNCGDQVREADGRHIAIVLAAFEWTVRVRWVDTGWKEDLPLHRVELVEARPGLSARYTAAIVRNRRRIGLPV